MKDGKVVLSVDFDGTICEHCFPHIGAPKPGAIKVIQALDTAGFKIIIHTCRVNPDLNEGQKAGYYVKQMEDWLKFNKIPYDEVWQGVGKPICHLYIDDHAFPFTGWDNVLDALLKMVNYVKTGKAVIPQETEKVDEVVKAELPTDEAKGKEFYETVKEIDKVLEEENPTKEEK